GIQDLDLVDDILGETLGGHFGICTEKYLPIDQDLVHRFSIDRYAPVTGHLDPWQFFQHILNRGIWAGLEGVRIELEGVLSYGKGDPFRNKVDPVQLQWLFFQLDGI